MNRRMQPHQSGFTLVEGLIALVIIGVGILSIASLQVGFIGSGSEAKARSVAAKLGQEKMEDLRSFSQRASGGNGVFGYAEIGTNSGGAENGDGTLVLPNGTVTEANIPYSRSWSAVDYYYPPDNASAVAAASWDSTNWGSLPSTSDYKAVTVTISWTDQDGASQSLQVNGVISAATPESSARTNQGAPTHESPIVEYDPGNAPDYVSVDLTTTKKKESGQPEPTVSQNEEFTTTQFDEVTYDTALETQRRDEFISVNCECEQDGTGSGYTPTVYRIMDAADVEDEDLVLQTLDDGRVAAWDVGEVITKRVGSRITTGQSGQQSEYCDICCRDHHDYDSDPTDSTQEYPLYDPFRANDATHYPSGLSGDHGHFYPDATGALQAADSSNDSYLEACRMVRVNGHLRVAQDWNMETLQLIPGAFLEEPNNLSAYVGDVTEFVEAYVDGISGVGTLDCDDNNSAPDYSGYAQSTPSPSGAFDNEPSTLDMAVGDSSELIARAVFIDHMDSELIEELQCRIANNDDFLDLLPFHEVNVTKLANWASSQGTNVSVTNEPLADDGTHSRGQATAESTGSSTITASIERSNTGLTDTNSIDPDDGDAGNTLTDTLEITVSGTSEPTGNPTVSGTLVIGGGTGVNPSDILVEAGAADVTCTKPTDESYSCELNTSGNGMIAISGYNSMKNPSTVQDNHLCTSTGLTGTVTDDNSLDETTTFSFSGQSTIVIDITVQKENQNC